MATAMTTSVKRLAEVQVLLRDSNEKIKGRNRDAHARSRMLFLCECSDLRCKELVKLTLREYEGVRSVPDRFLIAVGHETPEVEAVVAENKRFAVVEKLAAAKDVSTANDPRSRRSRGAQPDGRPRAL